MVSPEVVMLFPELVSPMIVFNVESCHQESIICTLINNNEVIIVRSGDTITLTSVISAYRFPPTNIIIL